MRPHGTFRTTCPSSSAIAVQVPVWGLWESECSVGDHPLNPKPCKGMLLDSTSIPLHYMLGTCITRVEVYVDEHMGTRLHTWEFQEIGDQTFQGLTHGKFGCISGGLCFRKPPHVHVHIPTVLSEGVQR